jgi:PucR C-terminal helix-turn-helix domain
VANKDGRVRLDPSVLAALRDALPSVARRTVDTLTDEVPAYGRADLGSDMAETIEGAVEMALGAFLGLAAEGRDADPTQPLGPAIEAAYALGRGEARTGRAIDALLAAYRVGARVAWRELSAEMVDRGVDAATIARFAEMVFAYIDQLSASSVAGHADELATSGRVRDQHLDELARGLLDGEPVDRLAARAERAEWAPPETLTLVLLPAAHLRAVRHGLDRRTLGVSGDAVPAGAGDIGALLVPDAHRGRAALLASLRGRSAVVGPARAWSDARTSHRRAVRALAVLPGPTDEPLDADAHLVELVLGADPDALADLRATALAPLQDLRPATAERLTETLRAWLLHQGRRDEVAATLQVHPQTVRYRMTQVRDLFGERLTDPRRSLELVVALALA